jgi:hypothetical protein
MASNITPRSPAGTEPPDPAEMLKGRSERALPGALQPAHTRPADAERVRELLRRGGLSPRAAARELEIDERAMRGYCTGRLVPRYLMLAIERLAELRRIKVYHLARAESVADILARGFRDDATTDLSSSHRGVLLADQLLVLLSNIQLDELACFEIKVPEDWLGRYEHHQAGRAYREFLVPAAELNDFPRRRLPDKEWRSMPWAR